MKMSKFSFNLDDREWGEFRIVDLFQKINIAFSTDYGKTVVGKTKFIGRTSTNNGVQGFVNLPENEKGDCITVSMVGENKSFYQKTGFATSQNILVIRSNFLNEFSSLFVSSILNNYLLTKYSYGNTVKKTTFPKEKILLPITQNGEPDYAFMENFIKERMYQKLKQYNDYLDKQIAQFAFSGSLKEKQ